MTDPNSYYPVNTIPALAWALDIYFKAGGAFKEAGVVEIVFPAGDHKELMRKKGKHEVLLWLSKRQIFVRARCDYDKSCSFNSERIAGEDREALKSLSWDEINDRSFFIAVRKWLIRYKFDFVTLIRALNTVCDRHVELPLTTKYGRTFKKFNDYRSHNWPEDTTPDNREKFLEEVLVRVTFWIQSAAEVDALKP
jgi:hypothetical protein